MYNATLYHLPNSSASALHSQLPFITPQEKKIVKSLLLNFIDILFVLMRKKDKYDFMHRVW
jgi:hypothetical protein